jgi:hypothetical protein
MIVCKQCGHHNEPGDTFCGSCGAFLEWMGEHIVEEVQPEPEPLPEVAVEPERAGLLTRIKEAVRGDDAPAAPLAAPGSFAPPGGPAPLSAPSMPPSSPVAAAPYQPPPAAPLAPPSGGFAPPSAGPAADPAALAAAAAARAAADEAARRAEREDAQRRAAAAMVAKPKPAPPAGPAPTRPVAAPAPSRAATPVAASGIAPTGPVTSDPTAGARQPSAQLPGAPTARPKPVTAKQAPSRIVNPGDLVCGQCGEGNEPTRKFCRRCGGTLAEAAAAPKVGWFKRTFSRKDKQPAALAAGSRPGRDGSGGGGGKGAAKSARIAKGKALGGFASFRRVLALLAMVGIGTTLAVPSLRTTVTDKASSILSSIKSKVNPSYTGVSPNPEGITATGETPGHEAKLAADGIKNDYWLAPADTAIAKVTMPFTTPERVDLILVYSGAQEKPEDFKAVPRPKDLFVRLVDTKGKETTKQFTIEDKADFQKLKISSKDVVLAEVTIQSCYPDPAVKVCAISELEFQKQK